METIKVFRVKVEGTTPLLISAFHGLAEAKQISSLPPKEQAAARLYAPPKGKQTLHIPSSWFQAALSQAFIDNAPQRRKIQAKKYIGGRVIVEPDMLDLATEEYEIRTRSVPSRGYAPGLTTRELKSTPMLRSWRVEFTLKTVLEKSVVRKLLEYAGSILGVGDDRIHGWGRFTLVTLEEVT